MLSLHTVCCVCACARCNELSHEGVAFQFHVRKKALLWDDRLLCCFALTAVGAERAAVAAGPRGDIGPHAVFAV